MGPLKSLDLGTRHNKSDFRGEPATDTRYASTEREYGRDRFACQFLLVEVIMRGETWYSLKAKLTRN